jgi:hypothetical protein
MFIARLRPALAGLMLVVFASVASAQDKPTLTATVNGSTVSLNWTVVPGATTYELLAQVGGSQFGPFSVGSGTSADIPGVPPGSYILQVRAASGAVKGPFSDPVTVDVGNLTPPAAPTDLAAVINGVSASLSWNLNNPAGSLTGVQLRVAMTPGGAPIAVLQLAPSSTSFLIPSAPPGSYYATVVAIGAGGSAASSEFTLTLPGCAAPPTIPLNASSIGAFIQFSWPQLPGSTGYTLEVGNTPGGGPNLAALPFGPTQTSFSYYGMPDGTYYATLRSALTCGASVSSAETLLAVAQPPQGPALSKAQAHSVLTEGARAMAAQYAGDLRNSCGNTNWVFKLLRHLRSIDTRFGMNYKRGQIGDLSQDVILYNFADVPNEQAIARHVYGWDVISQHCGGNPTWFNGDITNANGAARWTILEYLMAGYRP